MNLLCDYENYLRDRYILGQPVRYMYGGFGDASSGASASQSKQKVYGPDGNEYTYIDDPTSPNAGRYYRNVGGPGGGRIVFLDEVQEADQKRQMEDANKAAQPQVSDNRQSAQRPAQEKPARRPVKKAWNLTGIEDTNGDFLDVQVKASSEDEAKQIVADALKIQRDTRKKVGGGYSWELQEILEWGERNPEKFKQAVEDAKPQAVQPQTALKTEPSAPQTEQANADSAQYGSKKETAHQGSVDYSEFADAYKKYRAEGKKVASLKRKASKIQKAVLNPSLSATPEEIQSAKESLAKIRGEIASSEQVQRFLAPELAKFVDENRVVFIDNGDSFVINPSSELVQALGSRKELLDSLKKAQKASKEAKKRGLNGHAGELDSVAHKVEDEIARVNNLLAQMFPNETVVSAVDEKPKRRPANKKKEPKKDSILLKPFGEEVSWNAAASFPGTYGSYRQGSPRRYVSFPEIFQAIATNDLGFFDGTPRVDDDSEKITYRDRLIGETKQVTPLELYEFLKNGLAEHALDPGYEFTPGHASGFDEFFNPDLKALPSEYRYAVDYNSANAKATREVSDAVHILELFQNELENNDLPEDIGDALASYAHKVAETLPDAYDGSKEKRLFSTRVKSLVGAFGLAFLASETESKDVSSKALQLAQSYLDASVSDNPGRRLAYAHRQADKLGFKVPTSIDTYATLSIPAEYVDQSRRVEASEVPKGIAASEPEAIAPSAVEKPQSKPATSESDAQFDDSGLGLPGKSVASLEPDTAGNKDAAYFISRDLGTEPEEENAYGIDDETPTPEPRQRDMPSWLVEKAKREKDAFQERPFVTETRKRWNDPEFKNYRKLRKVIHSPLKKLAGDAVKKYLKEDFDLLMQQERALYPVITEEMLEEMQRETEEEKRLRARNQDSDYDRLLRRAGIAQGINEARHRRHVNFAEELLGWGYGLEEQLSNATGLSGDRLRAAIERYLDTETLRKKVRKDDRESGPASKEPETSVQEPETSVQEPESKDVIAREVVESETATLEHAPFDSAGLGLPGSQDSVLDANKGGNRDAAYFIQRDLGEEIPSDQKAQESPVATPEPTRQEQPAKPRPERWTPLKSSMNDDDKRVVESTRQRLNFGLADFAWRLAGAKEKKDWEKVKELTVLAAKRYLEQARRAYRSHGGADALAAFDETLSGEGLTVGQVRDRVIDKFRKMASMKINDLYKYAGERIDAYDEFSKASDASTNTRPLALNHLLDPQHRAPNAVPYTPPEKGGKVYEVPVDSLNLDPKRFQFKLNTNEQGVTDELDGATFDPELSGVIHVWRDPDDGKDYVVNGHHRFNLAKKSGYDKNVAVRYIDADTAEEAKAFGAVANIANQKGTPVDVADFIRSRGNDDIRTPSGGSLPVKNKLLADGRVLAKLDDTIFRKLKNGQVEESIARVIASELPDDKDKQLRLYSDIERLGLDASQAQDRAWAYASIQGEKQQGSLFGDDAPMEYDVESRSKLIGEIKKALSGAKNAARAGGSSKNNEYWNKQGLTTGFDRDRASQLSKTAGKTLQFFKDKIRLTGPMQNVIKEETDAYRKALKEGKDASQIVERAIERIKDVSQGGDGSLRRMEGLGLESEDRLPSVESEQAGQGVGKKKEGGKKRGSSGASSETVRDERTTGEVLEAGGTDRLSDGGNGSNPASVIAEEAEKSDVPKSRVREELDAPRQSKTSTPQKEEKPDWLVALESQEDLKPVSSGKYNPNAKPYIWKAEFPETEDELREYWREHVDGGEDEEVSFGSDEERVSVGEQSGDAPMTLDELRRFAQLRHGRELRKSLGLSEHFSEKELKELQEPSEKRGRGRPRKKTAGAEPLGKDVIQDRIAEALGIPSDTSKRKSSRRPQKTFDPDSIKDDVEKAVSIRDADRSQLSAESIDSMMRIAQSVSKKYGVDGLRDFMRRIDVVPLAKSRPKLLQELKDFLEDYRLNRYKATFIRNM